MSQYRRPAYAMAAPSRPARWPWALLIVVMLAIGAIGALIISDGSLTGGNDVTTSVPGPNGEMIIVSEADATETSAAATLAPVESQDGETNAADASESTDEPGGAPALEETGAPVPTATPAGPSNVEIAADWAAKWQAGDYQAMYALLSDTARGAITEEAFVERYQAVNERATITAVAVTMGTEPVPPEAALVPFSVAFTSTLLGEFEQDNGLPLVRQNGVWTVAWTPSAIFADLGDGCVTVDPQPTERGMILDRNGEVLAHDDSVVDIVVVPEEIADENALNRDLGGLLDMDEDEVAALYADAADPAWPVVIRTLPEREVRESILNDLGQIDGVRVVPRQSRLYPFGAVAAHITGYVTPVNEEDIAADPTLVDGNQLGRTGLEAGANDILSGVAGATLAIVDCNSREQRSTITDSPPVPGQDLILTIDIELQQTVDQVLTAVEGDDERASAVLIDPRNGAVLAMASHPTYDPNDFVLGFSDEEWERFNDETLVPRLDRAAEGLYPVGSIFKVITMAGGMAHLGYDENTLLDCPPSYELNGNIYNDWVIEWGEQPQGQLTLHDAIVQSCNTVFYDIGAQLDLRDDMLLPDMARAFGLGSPTNIPYLPEAGGTVPDLAWKADVIGDGWSTGDAINLAIGQGFLQATPLQMANVYATIANGGTLLEPFIVEYTQVPGGPATRVGERKEVGQLPLDAAQIGQIQSALRDQTSNAQERGSARVFGPGYPFAIAGKTGTSETQSTRNSQPHSWFAAFGPWESTASVPTLASVVMIETIGEGGKFAAPATKAIYDYYVTTDLSEQTEGGDSPPQAQEPRMPETATATIPSSTSPRPSASPRRGRAGGRSRPRR